MTPGEILPAESDPTVSDRLIELHRQFLEEAHPTWGSRQASALARQRETGSLALLLWKEKGGKAHALAWVQTTPEGLRVHGVWLETGGVAALAELLPEIERNQGCPVTAVTDVLPGITSEDARGFFAPRGFWHRAKVLMRRDPQVRTTTPMQSSRIRPIRPGDLREVVGIYVRAYSERPEEFWTWGVPDAQVEAERDVMNHLDERGQWVPDFLPEASFVWEEDGNVRGVCLVERGSSGIPWVEDLVVEPEFHRRGIGRALLESSVERLTREARRVVELCAIRHGAPYRLYAKLGFGEVPWPQGQLDGHWIRGRSPF